MKLQEIAAQLAADRVEHLAFEASSHGLDQYRLDGLRIAAAVSRTSLTIISIIIPARKHYFNAKMRLFEELVPVGGCAVINVDTPRGVQAAERCRARARLWTVGRAGEAIRVLDVCAATAASASSR
jgi:UDP-N-acetylmuramoyl-L-alanyl-D-glutamate--2,6-diaminopimelate ligase